MDVDVVVVGLGPGGELVATKLAEAGLEVVGVERRLVGGECPYFGCVPSKMMLQAAHALAAVRRLPDLAGTGSVQPDWSIVADRIRDDATDDWDDQVAVDRLEKAGVTVVRGAGRLVGPAGSRSTGRRTSRRAGSSSTPEPTRRCRRSTAWRTRRTGPTATW